jgi:SAM-dependent methyltransferase
MGMDFTTRFSGTRGYIRAHRPTYIFGYGGSAFLLAILLWLSTVQGWYSFVTLSLAGLLILTYFFAASLWAAHQLYDGHKIRDSLIKLSGLRPEDTLVHIDLGYRRLPADLSRGFTSGQVIVIDVYNPQLAPSRSLSRAQQQAVKPQEDPRLSWRDGSIDLLPLPDGSISAVTLVETASELWQQGDRIRLLKEVYRILAPGGRLLLAERMQSSTNFAVMGPSGLRLKSAGYWHNLLSENKFVLKDEVSLRDLICCIRADRPTIDQSQQLLLEI